MTLSDEELKYFEGLFNESETCTDVLNYLDMFRCDHDNYENALIELVDQIEYNCPENPMEEIYDIFDYFSNGEEQYLFALKDKKIYIYFRNMSECFTFYWNW